MRPHLLVLPSPFLGPAPYEPMVSALSDLGYTASVAPSSGSPDALELVASWSALARELGDVVLVPHSNAGYLAPAVSAGCGGLPVVFVDAALPMTEGTTRLAPPELRDWLASLAGPDGRLPRWTRWWDRADLADVLPGPWLDRLDAVLPEIPLAYVDPEVPVPADWERGRRAYLALGSTYADEWALAERHDWPRRRLDHAQHLHLLVAAEETAGVVAALIPQPSG